MPRERRETRAQRSARLLEQRKRIVGALAGIEKGWARTSEVIASCGDDGRVVGVVLYMAAMAGYVMRSPHGLWKISEKGREWLDA